MTDKIILKSIGGFYYVKSGDEIIECKAKGKFRNLSLSPLAGDIVDTEFDGSTNVISKIYPRKNKFIRPPFANLDLLILVASTVEPAPNFLVLDKMCATTTRPTDEELMWHCSIVMIYSTSKAAKPSPPQMTIRHAIYSRRGVRSTTSGCSLPSYIGHHASVV